MSRRIRYTEDICPRSVNSRLTSFSNFCGVYVITDISTMSGTNLMTTPRRSSTRLQMAVPLSSTMCQSPSMFVTPIVSSNNSGKMLHETPNRQFMFIHRSSRDSSTPKRQMSFCPFTTPDRLGEPLSAEEDFESSNKMISQPLADTSFSPCIDWQSTMNPTAFDISNPALYLPPTRTASVEQRAQKRIAEFFREKQIVPSPCTAENAGRSRCYISLDSPKMVQDVTLSSKRMSSSPKKISVRSSATQTCVTIPPDVDLNQLLAPFATYVETESRESLMDASLGSGSSGSGSSDSICSISRRKLFTEDDESPAPDQHAQPSRHLEQDTDNQETTPVLQKNHNFNETIALSSPPRTMRAGCSVLMNSFEFPDTPNIESSRLMCHDGERDTDRNPADHDGDEIPRGEFDIELSPIKSPQQSCHNSELHVSSLQIGDASNHEKMTSTMATKSSDQGFQSQEDGCYITTSHVEGASNMIDFTDVTSME